MRTILSRVLLILTLLGLGASALVLRTLRPNTRLPGLVFAGVPISGMVATADSLARVGYPTWSVAAGRAANGECARYDARLAFDPTDPSGQRAFRFAVRHLSVFWKAARHHHILHAYFNGGMLAAGPLRDWEFRLWKLAGRKLVLMPYGSDAFIYADMPDTEWSRRIRDTYPRTAREDAAVAKRVRANARLADAVVGCLIHHVTLPNVTHNPLLWYPCETLNGVRPPRTKGPIRVVHATNHPGVKGTKALQRAVAALRADGHDIVLQVVSGATRATVIEAMKDADIVVDQLHMGYALAAVEGMGLGKVVVTGVDLTDPTYIPHRARLEASPLIFASVSTIQSVLTDLINRRVEWPYIGQRTRAFALKHHGQQPVVAMFENLYRGLGFVIPKAFA